MAGENDMESQSDDEEDPLTTRPVVDPHPSPVQKRKVSLDPTGSSPPFLGTTAQSPAKMRHGSPYPMAPGLFQGAGEYGRDPAVMRRQKDTPGISAQGNGSWDHPVPPMVSPHQRYPPMIPPHYRHPHPHTSSFGNGPGHPGSNLMRQVPGNSFQREYGRHGPPPPPLHQNQLRNGPFRPHANVMLSRREAAGPECPTSADLEAEEDIMQTLTRKKRANTVATFPSKLHKILSDPKYCDYVDWLPHGRAWRILKPKGFETDVLPVYFRSKRYASFMRQVNGWGFKRITEGPDLNAYYHELFLRGMPQLCFKMRRTTAKNKGGTDTGESPDFYKISMFAPLPDPDVPTQTSAPRTIVTKDSSSQEPTKRPSSPSSVSTMTGSYDRGNQQPRVTNMPKSPSAFSRGSPLPVSMNIPFPSSPRLDLLGSSSNSLSSWVGGEQEEFDDGSASNFFGPLDSGSTIMPLEVQKSASQITPLGRRPYSTPHNARSLPSPVDSSGLSVADMCYLTQQNRILLEQARSGGDASPTEDN